MDCPNYRGIKLIAHTMKIYERLLDMRLRDMVEIAPDQFGFVPSAARVAKATVAISIQTVRPGQAKASAIAIPHGCSPTANCHAKIARTNPMRYPWIQNVSFDNSYVHVNSHKCSTPTLMPP
ncbi:hypothetical protein ANCDUO_22720 [Ancylostoma duodenale]|uniref:Reverse transcriptase domain-containing protein n=1 Tax=Ancylostoma duodenale TaxID=51022 RepID=A0A0C2BTI3_9BILA|nr:hypothetical protein ANCDUO_22720 [Ancylostoma duodenale]